MTTDPDIRATISTLISREHDLRARRAAGLLDATAEHSELTQTEIQLDQCWDLLCQREAAREFGRDPNQVKVRSSSVVEGYRQ
ncbi:DUF2630 family protein [Isoptericola sp. NPDC019693]|uniref:DUF2630 family protein n=1 Tax=Isoptericola sp. NPDC019693 TaxID=3364009 RepID=UPI003793B42E